MSLPSCWWAHGIFVPLSSLLPEVQLINFYLSIYTAVRFILITSWFLKFPSRLLAALTGPGHPREEKFQGPVQGFKRRSHWRCITRMSHLIVNICCLRLWNFPSVRIVGPRSSLIRVIPVCGITTPGGICVSHRSFVRDRSAANRTSSDIRWTPQPIIPGGIAGWVIPSSCGTIGLSSVSILVEVHIRLSASLPRVCSFFLDPLLFPRRPSSLSTLAWVRLFIIVSILVSRVPRVCSCWLRRCSRSSLNRFSLSSASLVIRDKFLVKRSSVLSFKRFSLLLTSCLLRLISSRWLSLSTWTVLSSSLIIIEICSLCSPMP